MCRYTHGKGLSHLRPVLVPCQGPQQYIKFAQNGGTVAIFHSKDKQNKGASQEEQKKALKIKKLVRFSVVMKNLRALC